LINKRKYDISFTEVGALWDDPDRLEIEAPFPLENRYILIEKITNLIGLLFIPSEKEPFGSFPSDVPEKKDLQEIKALKGTVLLKVKQ
jgi:hypothetical protein